MLFSFSMLKSFVRNSVGSFGVPDYFIYGDLPKTRSGKIMRRILRKIASGSTKKEDFGDTSTLADPSVRCGFFFFLVFASNNCFVCTGGGQAHGAVQRQQTGNTECGQEVTLKTSIFNFTKQISSASLLLLDMYKIIVDISDLSLLSVLFGFI